MFSVANRLNTLGSLVGSQGNRTINQKLNMAEWQLRSCWKDIQERKWFMTEKAKVHPNWGSGASFQFFANFGLKEPEWP